MIAFYIILKAIMAFHNRRPIMSMNTNVLSVDAEQFLNMILAGADNLEFYKEKVNTLNVFPVPDGDTGTNMAMTMKSAAKFVQQVETASLEKYAEQMAYGSVMGARGNSGVILSQILTGLAYSLKGHTEIKPQDLVQGFNAGAQYAYRAVSNPMEGTILTVVREAGEALSAKYKDDMDIIQCLQLYIKEGHKSLDKTPELLPVLKQAGVVDAGGCGFLYVIEGMLACLEGKEIERRSDNEMADQDLNDQFDHFFTNPEDIIYPYCTEFLVRTDKEDVSESIEQLKAAIHSYGDCMLVVGAGNTIKVHIHTDRLANVIEQGSSFGELDDIKINNMRSQNQALSGPSAPVVYKDAILVVCNGDGFSEIFKGMGATHIISGGQTMNPSTQDFLDVIENIEAENVYIFPNNKNIIMTAQQAANIVTTTNVQVIPSKSFPQGIAALMQYIPDTSSEENTSNMMQGIQNVQSGEITQAVRDTTIDGVEIAKDEYMSIVDSKIASSEVTIERALEELITYTEENDAEFISLYYGEEIDKVTASEHLELLESKFEDIEFELYYGGQSVYHYIVSAE